MAKQYRWSIQEDEINEESGEPTGKQIEHTVELTCSYLTGKAVITIDGDRFDISTRPFALRGTNQMFRLGDLAAQVEFPKQGSPRIIVDGEAVPQKV